MPQIAKPIPVAGPSITRKEISYVADATKNGWYAHANDYITRFEQAFAAYTGRRHAISLPSCTSALHLSLLALGVGEGDEVIVPEATWIASSAPITYVGATPVFADIDPRTWCLSADTIAARITNKTKAIIVVNLYGNMAEWAPILKLAKQHGIAIIEDAAESIGSRYQGSISGSVGAISCFSFHGSKTLTTGEGGMLLTDDAKIYQRCLQLRDHGRAPGDIHFRNLEVGYKYKMSALQAALGLAQLERIAVLLKKKRQIFAWYQKYLPASTGLRLNPDHPHVENSYWMSTVIWDSALGISKPALMAALAAEGIASRPFFDPLSSLEAYREHAAGGNYAKRNPNAYAIAACAINLPSALCLKEADVRRVAKVLCEAIASLAAHR
jgi:perosamine synthetase